MEGLEDLQVIVETAIFSGYIVGERPLSVLIVARVESGKSQLVLKYCSNKGVTQLDDMTAWALTNPKRDIYQNLVSHRTHTIICPDLLIPLARNRDTVNTLINFLLGLIEDGTMHIQTFATNLALAEPLRCGLITTISKEELEVHRHQWKRIGFMSRLLPISYSYSPLTVSHISKSIAQRHYQTDGNIMLDLPKESISIELPTVIAERIEHFTPNVNAQMVEANQLYGFRLQKQLQTFVQAHALRAGRTKVNAEDFDVMSDLTKYLNLRYTQL